MKHTPGTHAGVSETIVEMAAETLAIAQELDAACEIVRRHAREIRDRARSMPHARGLLHAVELSMLGQAEALRKMANAKDPTRLPLVPRWVIEVLRNPRRDVEDEIARARRYVDELQSGPTTTPLGKPGPVAGSVSNP